MPTSPRRISLEIEGEEGPMHGRVAEAGHAGLEFEGWLGLLTVLGHLLDDAAEGAESSPPLTDPQ